MIKPGQTVVGPGLPKPGGRGANLSVRHKNLLFGKIFTKKMHEMKKSGPGDVSSAP